MLKLGAALGGFRPGAGETQATEPIVLLGAAWAEIAGEGMAANSHPAKLDGDTLLVTTSSSGWSQQLSFLCEPILAAIRARLPHAGIEKLRFRVGKLPKRGASARGARTETAARAVVAERPPARDADEALARFRADVDASERAKRERGWNECDGCSALIAPGSGSTCVSCAVAQGQERERLVSRLLFEAPWLGYAGTASLVEDLDRDAYDSIRLRLLGRWWERLNRARAAGRLSRDGSERSVASSYVLLKSELPPERITPATVRNVLGDELHELLYGRSEQQNDVQ
ncbi:MAG: DUF721 domain-containing protein [bacterium]|nr:DUF721 domain-containing protein [bacterium]